MANPNVWIKRKIDDRRKKNWKAVSGVRVVRFGSTVVAEIERIYRSHLVKSEFGFHQIHAPSQV